jgi:hypothetical protein
MGTMLQKNRAIGLVCAQVTALKNKAFEEYLKN